MLGPNGDSGLMKQPYRAWSEISGSVHSGLRTAQEGILVEEVDTDVEWPTCNSAPKYDQSAWLVAQASFVWVSGV